MDKFRKYFLWMSAVDVRSYFFLQKILLVLETSETSVCQAGVYKMNLRLNKYSLKLFAKKTFEKKI